MIYVFDSGPFIVLFNHYYRDRFPSLWQRFDDSISSGLITAPREVLREIEGRGDNLSTWSTDNHNYFDRPSPEEFAIVADIFKEPHFQTLIRDRQRLQGTPVADPFVIAKAKAATDGCVVTQEKKKPNAAQIPNVCEHFHIPYLTLEGFMEREDWTF